MYVFIVQFLSSLELFSGGSCYVLVWYGMVWYGMVWYGMVWYCMVLVVMYIVTGPSWCPTGFREAVVVRELCGPDEDSQLEPCLPPHPPPPPTTHSLS